MRHTKTKRCIKAKTTKKNKKMTRKEIQKICEKAKEEAIGCSPTTKNIIKELFGENYAGNSIIFGALNSVISPTENAEKDSEVKLFIRTEKHSFSRDVNLIISLNATKNEHGIRKGYGEIELRISPSHRISLPVRWNNDLMSWEIAYISVSVGMSIAYPHITSVARKYGINVIT